MLPGSSAGWNSFWSVFLTYQSRMRPTNGDIRVTFASAHATAWGERKGKITNKVSLIMCMFICTPKIFEAKTCLQQNAPNFGADTCFVWTEVTYIYLLVCSFYYVACSQNRMHFAPKMFIILKVKERLPEQMRKEGSCCNGYPLARASWKVPIVESLKYFKNYSLNIIHGIINMCGQIDHLPLANTCSVSHTHLTVCGYSLSALQLVESCFTIGWI